MSTAGSCESETNSTDLGLFRPAISRALEPELTSARGFGLNATASPDLSASQDIPAELVACRLGYAVLPLLPLWLAVHRRWRDCALVLVLFAVLLVCAIRVPSAILGWMAACVASRYLVPLRAPPTPGPHYAEIAWRSGRYRSPAHFLAVRNSWRMWGRIIWVAGIAYGIGAMAYWATVVGPTCGCK